MGGMAEIQRRQVEEVDNQQNFRPEKVGASEEHNPTKLEKIVEDEMTSNRSGRIDKVCVCGEQMPDVTDLKDEQHNPKKLISIQWKILN